MERGSESRLSAWATASPPLASRTASGIAEPGPEPSQLRQQIDALQQRLAELEGLPRETLQSDSTAPAARASAKDELAGTAEEGLDTISRAAFRDRGETGEELEESVRQYMERLLQTLGGTSAQPSEAMMHSPSLGPASATIRPPADHGPPALPPLPPLQEPLPIQEPQPVDLTALRQLASVAAKSAQIEYQSRRYARQALDKLLVTLVCLPCGLLLLYWSFTHRLTLAYTASGLAFFVVVCWGLQAVRCAARLALGRLALARLWYEYGRRP